MRIQCYKYTKDDWYPNYPRDMVVVNLSDISDGQTRVSIWGADDFGMEFDFATEIDAKNMYYTVCMMETVEIEELKKLGFTRT